MKKMVVSMSAIALLTVLGGCATKVLPESILVNAPLLYPEGIAYHDKQFYLSSIYEGKIISVDLEGKMKVFVEDDTLISTIGLHVDKINSRLIVCNSDAGFGKKSKDGTKGKVAEIVFYDLKTAKKLQSISLASLYKGGHFANDFTFDHKGNIYVTDSFSPVIYKIDRKGKATLFTKSRLFSAPKGHFGLNGIVYHDNYLIVGRADTGRLYKVSLSNPEKIDEVFMREKVHSIDGLLMQKDGSLIVVSNNFSQKGFDEAVYKLHSRDGWRSATVVGSKTIKGWVFPTTVTEIENTVYVNLSYLPFLAMKKRAVKSFKIQKIDFR